jgi:hypothetical protein
MRYTAASPVFSVADIALWVGVRKLPVHAALLQTRLTRFFYHLCVLCTEVSVNMWRHVHDDACVVAPHYSHREHRLHKVLTCGQSMHLSGGNHDSILMHWHYVHRAGGQSRARGVDRQRHGLPGRPPVLHLRPHRCLAPGTRTSVVSQQQSELCFLFACIGC